MLLDRFTSIVTSKAKIRQVYARFNDGMGRTEKALDCRLKQCRALQSAGWETERQGAQEMCQARETRRTASLMGPRRHCMRVDDCAFVACSRRLSKTFPQWRHVSRCKKR